MNDDAPDPRDSRDPRDPPMPDDRAPDRRTVWSRRVAIAVLVTFGAFVLLNVVVVLAMLLATARGGGAPFN